ncbi:MAG: hypothetical protein AAF827_02505, partial [Cyanobacteria bacterium P01_D01_bin.6]
ERWVSFLNRNLHHLKFNNACLLTTTVTVNPGDEAFQAAIPLLSLDVGTDEVQMASAAAPDFLAATSAFTVWPNTDVIDAAAAGSLASNSISLLDLKVCEKNLSPKEMEQTLLTEDLQGTDASRGDLCGDSQDSFPVGTQTVNADVSIGSRFTEATQSLQLTFRELRLNNIPPTLLPIHPATVLSGYFIFKPIPYLALRC